MQPPYAGDALRSFAACQSFRIPSAWCQPKLTRSREPTLQYHHLKWAFLKLTGTPLIKQYDSQDGRDCSFCLSRIAYFNALLLRSRLAIALYEIRTGRGVKLF